MHSLRVLSICSGCSGAQLGVLLSFHRSSFLTFLLYCCCARARIKQTGCSGWQLTTSTMSTHRLSLCIVCSGWLSAGPAVEQSAYRRRKVTKLRAMQATMWRCPSNNQRNIRWCVAGVVFIPLHSYHTSDYIRHSVCPVLLSLCTYTPHLLVLTVFSAMPRKVLFPCAICENQQNARSRRSNARSAACGYMQHLLRCRMLT